MLEFENRDIIFECSRNIKKKALKLKLRSYILYEEVAGNSCNFFYKKSLFVCAVNEYRLVREKNNDERASLKQVRI